MATTEIREKQTERDIKVYPVAELISALDRMLKETIPIKIALVSDTTGDVAFITSLSDLGITRQTFSHPFYHSHLFADLLGELLIRQTDNFNALCDRVMVDKSYNILTRKYRHTGMGLRLIQNDRLMFQFNISLLYNLKNEEINQIIIDEHPKVVIANAKKIKREEQNESISTYCDETNIRLVVPKTNEVRKFRRAIELILEFYKISKEVDITDNIFSYEIQVKDKDK